MVNNYDAAINYNYGTNPAENVMVSSENIQNITPTYNAGYPQSYAVSPHNTVLPAVLKSAGIGFIGGAGITTIVQYLKNRKPVKNNGEVSENFAKQVLNRMIERDYAAKGKEFFKQKYDVIKKLSKISTPEEFKKLMSKNKKFFSSICNTLSFDTLRQTINADNLKNKIKTLKSRLEAESKQELQNVKDTVKLCWDSENKKFVKPENVDKKIFNLIKNTKNNIPWSKALKYGGITAGIFGSLTLGAAYLAKRNSQNYYSGM